MRFNDQKKELENEESGINYRWPFLNEEEKTKTALKIIIKLKKSYGLPSVFRSISTHGIRSYPFLK